MDNVIFIIFGMAAVTYIPRLLPFILMPDRDLPQRVNLFLKCIPAAAIGALIIPGVLDATPGAPLAAVAGMIFTLGFGLWKGGIIIPVLGSVAVTYICLLYWG